MYADYLKEREDREVYEGPFGFASYKFLDGGLCYIIDIYVVPEERKTYAAATMADAIVKLAKEKGCTSLVGSVDTNAKDPTANMKVLLAYGMSFDSIGGSMLYFKKEI